MRKKYTESLKCKVIERLESLSNNVVLRADFADLGGYRQISRALNTLVADKKLAKIGFGVYAKAYSSKYTSTPLILGGIDVAFREVLDRLNVSWQVSEPEQAYNQGKTTQVPVYNVVRLKSRFRRRIGYGKSHLLFEGKINAR